MSREIVVSSTQHETRLAILDDDQLVEIYIERESDQGLAGSIHKGRVTRVLPGMQSAFVDIGLERDAFLYVSDFLDTSAEFEEGEDEPPSRKRKSVEAAKSADQDVTETQEDGVDAANAQDRSRKEGRAGSGGRRRSRRGRRRGGRGRSGNDDRGGRPSLPESKFASMALIEEDDTESRDETSAGEERKEDAAADETSFEVLPGESLAKYRAPAKDDSAEETREESPAETDRVQPREGVEAGVPAQAAIHEEEYDHRDEELASVEEEDQGDNGSAEEDYEGDDDEDVNGDSDEEEDDDDDSIDFSEHLEEAERIAALVEEQDDEDANEIGRPLDSRLELDAESTDDGESEDEEQQEEISEFRIEDIQNDEADDWETTSVAEVVGQTAAERDERSVVPGPPLDENEPSDSVAEQASGDDHGSTIPGQPETARVRGRSRSRNLQRRGRRGRRRGGQSRERHPREERPQDSEPRTSVAPSFDTPSEGKITDLLKKGNEILVQIAKEPLGKKGARITSHIALPGRYLVYMPTVDHIGVSRKIDSFDERKRLRQIVRGHRTGMPGGFIVRTAAAGTTEEDIRGDMLFLYNLWLDIRQKAEDRGNPGLVHQDLDIVERVLRDQLDEDFKAVWVDAEDEYERVLRFVERFQPGLLPKVKLYTRRRPIFDEFNITNALEKAMRPKVWLKSGGYIVINQTEALVAVDVNTGKYVGKSDRLEDTIVNTNIEAAKEVVRQVRLRDLGGIIVVDFIDMDDRKNRQKVLQVLEQAMQSDPAPSKSLAFNDFGLVAITRKRVKQSLERTLCSACPTCSGSGHLKSVTTVILEILQEAHKLAPGMDPQKDITLRVNPEIGRTLKSRKNNYLQELESILKSHIVVRSDLSLHREKFDIN